MHRTGRIATLFLMCLLLSIQAILFLFGMAPAPSGPQLQSLPSTTTEIQGVTQAREQIEKNSLNFCTH